MTKIAFLDFKYIKLLKIYYKKYIVIFKNYTIEITSINKQPVDSSN